MTSELKQEYTLRITQASRTEIIVIMYDMVKQYLEDAMAIYDEGTHEEYRKHVGYAQRVIKDLIDSLDMSYDLAAYLLKIYLLVQRKLSSCVILNTKDGIEKVISVMESVKESFVQVAKQDTEGPVMGNTQAVYAGLTYGKGTLNENVSTQANRGFTV